MSHFDLLSSQKDDRDILKYFWFLIFTLHIIFMLMAIYWLNQGLDFDVTQLSYEGLRIDKLFIAIHMGSIAFSMLLLIIAIYANVLASRQNKMLKQLREMQASLLSLQTNTKDSSNE
jgi:hypothetical protein